MATLSVEVADETKSVVSCSGVIPAGGGGGGHGPRGGGGEPFRKKRERSTIILGEGHIACNSQRTVYLVNCGHSSLAVGKYHSTEVSPRNDNGLFR